MSDQGPHEEAQTNQRRPRRGRPPIVDKDKLWLQIRTAYLIRGWTMEQCAEAFPEITSSAIRMRAGKEGWADQRKQITAQGHEMLNEELRTAVRDQVAEVLKGTKLEVQSRITILERGTRIADKLALAAEQLLEEYLDGLIYPGDRQSKADVLNACADAARKAVQVGRDIAGLETGQANVEDEKSRSKTISVVVQPPPPEFLQQREAEKKVS